MKNLSMAISSPVRREKFPPPPRKFSRTRSSLSAPVFHIRGRKNAAGMIETGNQEPFSPKVTCIGQVRPRRRRLRRRRCWLWRRRRVFMRVLWRLAAFLRSGYCKRVDHAEEGCFRKMELEGFGGKFGNVLECSSGPMKLGIRQERLESTRNLEVVSDGGELEGVILVHPLMLTRCRSEPAARFRERFAPIVFSSNEDL